MAKKKKVKKNKPVTNGIEHFTTNFAASVRYDTMEGREYIVAPMIMLMEGVHNGSNGPVYYSQEELSKTPVVWNAKPVVVYHPQIDGQGVSACDPLIYTNHKVGVIMNTHYDDGKLKAEAWLEIDRVKAVDERVLDSLESGEMMELSTGLFTDNEYVEGDWNGEHYSAVVSNFRPDHLALLPDQKGACSIDDGAGFLRLNQKGSEMDKLLSLIVANLQTYKADQETDKDEMVANQYTEEILKIIKNQMSHDNIREQLSRMINEANGTDDWVWIPDVYDDFFVYEFQGKLWRQDYAKDNDNIEFVGVPSEVVLVQEYKAPEGTFVGNKKPEKIVNNERNIPMDRKSKIEALIANGNWIEEDRDFLTNMEEGPFEKIVAGDKAKSTPVANTEPAPVKEEVVEEVLVDNKAKTVEESISTFAPEVQAMIRNGMNSYAKEKTELITKITSNKLNQFTQEQLNGKDLPELKMIANLVTEHNTPDYSGQGDPPPNTNTEVEEPMALPVMNFGN